MKKQIFAHLDEGGAGLDPLTLKALQKLKADMHGKSTMAEAQAAAALDQMAEVGPDLVLGDGAGGSASPTGKVPQPTQPQKSKVRGNDKRART